MSEDLDLLTALDTFEESAWRLASHDLYEVPEDHASVDAWTRRGEFVAPASDWPSLVQARTSTGRAMGRVQVVTRPVSEYMAWRLSCYMLHSIAGEVVQLAYRDEMPADLAGIHEDFWVFDDRNVIVMDYDERGALRGNHDDSTHLDRYLGLRERLIDACPQNLFW